MTPPQDDKQLHVVLTLSVTKGKHPFDQPLEVHSAGSMILKENRAVTPDRPSFLDCPPIKTYHCEFYTLTHLPGTSNSPSTV